MLTDDRGADLLHHVLGVRPELEVVDRYDLIQHKLVAASR
jgi:hypothetical protein